MLEADLQAKSKHIDSFLSKHPKVLKNLQDMVTNTTEFPSRQNLIYNLMNLTTDVSTFGTELSIYLAEDKELARKIIDKARLSARLSRTQVTAAELKRSIQRLGYDFVHNEVQQSLAKQYVKVYYSNKDQAVKKLIANSVRLAVVANQLAKLINYSETTMAYFAGLNYYMGELMVSLRDQRSYQEIEKMKAKGVEAKGAELAVLGFDTTELAARKLEEWQLPEAVVDVVKNSRNLSEVREANYKASILLKFAEYITQSLSNKKMGPYSMWDKAYEYLAKLGYEMTIEKWAEEIKLMYIRVLEIEHALYQR